MLRGRKKQRESQNLPSTRFKTVKLITLNVSGILPAIYPIFNSLPNFGVEKAIKKCNREALKRWKYNSLYEMIRWKTRFFCVLKRKKVEWKFSVFSPKINFLIFFQSTEVELWNFSFFPSEFAQFLIARISSVGDNTLRCNSATDKMNENNFLLEIVTIIIFSLRRSTFSRWLTWTWIR